MMEDFWQMWTNLSIDDQTNVSGLTKLKDIEKESDGEVTFETREESEGELLKNFFESYFPTIEFINFNRFCNKIYITTQR